MQTILELNKNRFEWVHQRAVAAFEQSKHEQAVAWAYLAGFCAWRAHMGQFAHPGLESLLHNIGTNLTPSNTFMPVNSAQTFSRRRWLHVLSSAFGIGGHTRLVQQWIKKDFGRKECHSVLLTDQRNFSVPDWLTKTVVATEGQLTVLPPGMDIFERARSMRNIAMSCADIVVLHTNPNDPLPLLAFAAENLPPILLMNHADHVFWYGATLADAVADLRPSSQEVTLKRRLIKNTHILPIPLELPAAPSKSKLDAKRQLSLPEDSVMLLTIGSNYKYLPYRNLSFPAAAIEILQQNPSAILVVIGTEKKNKDWINASKCIGERLVLAGRQENIENYYKASDIYLESFPLGSLTATLDAVLYDTPVVRAPELALEILGLDRYDGMNNNASTIEEYYTYINHLINNSSNRLEVSQLQKQSVLSAHTGEGWRQQLDTLVSKLPTHHNTGISNQLSFTTQPENSDNIWAELQRLHEGTKILSRAYFDNPGYSKYLKPDLLDRLKALSISRGQYHPEFRTVMLKINKRLPVI
ncbi:MAG: hypothetical protein A2X83_02450 [Desulfuromonadales bacterium GWD2_54_10]|nr:MAG: hypothetical protein A2X83_02450 [Desulfuromonadales bacterium GWD2_54_10]